MDPFKGLSEEEMSNTVDRYWWVVQILRGVYSVYGPYKSKEAAVNRYNKTFGGEVYLYDSWETDPSKVIEEFKLTQIE